MDAGVAAGCLPPLVDHGGAHVARVSYPKIDFQDYYYYSQPKPKLASLDEVDPEILATYDKLGIPLREREALLGVESSAPRIAVDAVFDRREFLAATGGPSLFVGMAYSNPSCSPSAISASWR